MGQLILLLALQADAAEWVRRLGADNLDEREAAVEALTRAGDEARDALWAGSWSADPEIAARARALLPASLAAVDRGLRRAFREAERALAEGRPADALRGLGPVAWLSPSDLVPDVSSTRPEISEVRRLLARLRAAVPSLRFGDRAALAFDEAQAEASAAGHVRRRLSSRVDLRFENARFEEILTVLGTLTGTAVHLDAAAMERAELGYAVTFEAHDRSLGEILGSLTDQADLAWKVTEEGVILVGPKS
ncbi:MAG TPA: hypothetical protein VEJ18_08665 [Planctomycetota bacterium]|nr:hypothetical protein [Planctomycetota bacterium]